MSHKKKEIKDVVDTYLKRLENTSKEAKEVLVYESKQEEI